MEHRKLAKVLAAMAVLVFVLLVPFPALAQGCALCYTQAAGSGSRMIQALKGGILILIAPPTLMSLGLIVVCYRERNNTRNTTGEIENGWEKEESEKW